MHKKWFHPTRKELKFRIGFIVFLILYLLACYWIFGLESYNKVGCIIFIKYEEVIGEILQYKLLLHL